MQTIIEHPKKKEALDLLLITETEALDFERDISKWFRVDDLVGVWGSVCEIVIKYNTIFEEIHKYVVEANRTFDKLDSILFYKFARPHLLDFLGAIVKELKSKGKFIKSASIKEYSCAACKSNKCKISVSKLLPHNVLNNYCMFGKWKELL